MKPKTFTFGDTGYPHEVSNSKCEWGWCNGGSSYPKPCKKCGKGLIHANFGDENFDGDYWLYTKCDMCGESE